MLATQLTIAQPKRVRVIRPEQPKQTRYAWLIRKLNEQYAVGDIAEASRSILRILDELGAEHRPPSPKVNAEVSQAIHAALSVMTQADFRIPENHANGYLFHVSTIANALAAATDATSDAWRASVAGDKQEAFKACLLSSPREMTPFPFGRLMDAAPDLASAWFCQAFKTAFAGNVCERTRKNLIELARSLDDRFVQCKDMQEPYFLVTYLGDDEAERNVKFHINNAIKRNAIDIRPGKRSKIVAVASDNWMPGHSVWRTLKGYIDALRPEYELVLLHSHRDAAVLDKEGFSETIKIPHDGTHTDLSVLHDRGFCGLIVPDVGMTGWSIALANHRVAPVQVMMTGHPVSTFGSEIDYFLCGEDMTPESQNYYSEKLVRVPGFGAIHEEPTYQPRGTPKDYDGIIINCSWYGQKVTAEWVKFVGQIVKATGKKVKLHVFAGGAATGRSGFSPFLRAFDKQLDGVEAELFPHLDYPEYMAQLERGDFAVDCFPFAGSNTVSDNLHLRKPVVCLEGRRWFNRIGPAMLRSCGLAKLVAHDNEEFESVLSCMIKNDTFRENMITQARNTDLGFKVYARRGALEFAQWFRDQVAS